MYKIIKNISTLFSINLVPIKFREKSKISNGNRTEWSPIRSVIIRVINKINLFNHEYDYRLNWTTRSSVTN